MQWELKKNLKYLLPTGNGLPTLYFELFGFQGLLSRISRILPGFQDSRIPFFFLLEGLEFIDSGILGF